MNNSYSITSKGQVTLPKKLRDAVGLSTDDRVSFVRKGTDIIIRKEPSLDDVTTKFQRKFLQSGISAATQQDYDDARSKFTKQGSKW